MKKKMKEIEEMRKKKDDAKSTGEIEEMMDRKVEHTYEKLRNDNWVIWKESIKKAEEQFSNKGIEDTMHLLPNIVYDKTDLKR